MRLGHTHLKEPHTTFTLNTMPKPIPLPPVEVLHNWFYYKPHEGTFLWKNHPTGRADPNTPVKMSEASDYKYPVIRLMVSCKMFRLYPHRVAWKMFYGTEPPEQIDHRDMDKWNQSISNLRDGTGSKNQHNTKGFGAYPSKNNRWQSVICIGGRQRNLGYYDCPLLAGISYLNTKSVLHPWSDPNHEPNFIYNDWKESQ